MWNYIIIFGVLIIMMAFYIRCKKPVVSFILGSGSGLIALSIAGFLTTELIKLNLLTVFMSILAGVPGLITIVLLEKLII